MKRLLLSAILYFSYAIGMEEDSNTVPNMFGGQTTTKYFTDGSSEKTSTTGGGYSNVKKHYPDGSMMVEITAPDGSKMVKKTAPDGSKMVKKIDPDGSKMVKKTAPDGSKMVKKIDPDGSAIVKKIDRDGSAIVNIIAPDGSVGFLKDLLVTDSDVDHSGSSVKESGAKKPNTFTRINSDIKRIESLEGSRPNVPSKKKENFILNAKMEAWMRKPTEGYDYARSKQEVDEPIRSRDNVVKKTGEQHSRIICDSMAKYADLRKPLQIESGIILMNKGGFNREQLLEQINPVTDKIELLTDECAREFIRMRGDIPEEEIENYLEEVKDLIKDEWFKNYSHAI